MVPPPRKRFAQHWLRDESVLQRMVAAAQLQPHDRVLEIGPGRGVLTARLLSAVAHLWAVEIDRDRCAELRQKFGDRPHFSLIEGDILTIALPPATKTVANIPYNLTGPILEKLLGTMAQPQRQFERVVLLVQQEIADRLTAVPCTKAYGALSVRMQYLTKTEVVCTVPPQAFVPPPKVTSAVVSLIPKPLVSTHPKLLETVTKAGFANRRKFLRNNLKALLGDRLEGVWAALGWGPTVRAEELPLTEWLRLVAVLENLT
ncbi:MAG: 16S rRNA (adenine(1518)-N(6)/adenine(1519)-N(6))-dimethyltransferase RsmA [Pseudanabaenaceae cyanobacterium]